MARCEARNHPIPIANIENHIAIQVVLKQPEKGIGIYKKHENQIVKSRSAVNIAILVSFCHLFLKQPDQAISPHSGIYEVNPLENAVISRLIYAIAFFIRGDFDWRLMNAAT